MTDTDLDTVYTALCQHMTALGEARSPLFLARLALLALQRLEDASAALQLVQAAAQDLAPAPHSRPDPEPLEHA